MADVSSEGKRDFKQPSESSPSTNIRPDVGQNPNTQQGPYGQFEHTAFDASYDHTPFTSVNPPSSVGVSSKYIHPFMLERFVDENENPRLRIYSGVLFTSINVIQTEVQSDTTSSGNTADKFVTIFKQKPIEGLNPQEVMDPNGNSLTALQDEDGNDTVNKAYDFPVGQAYGTYYLSWRIDMGSLQAASVTVSNIKLFRHAATVSDTKIGEARQVDINGNPISNAIDTNLQNMARDASQVEGNYFVKLGQSFDPSQASTNNKTIEQIIHENIYWQPLIIGPTQVS